MKRVEMFKTADGQTFPTAELASGHAEGLYMDAIGSLAHRMVHLEKYSQMREWLHQNREELAQLVTLHADIACENPEEN
jgi:hypothetical protein